MEGLSEAVRLLKIDGTGRTGDEVGRRAVLSLDDGKVLVEDIVGATVRD